MEYQDGVSYNYRTDLVPQEVIKKAIDDNPFCSRECKVICNMGETTCMNIPVNYYNKDGHLVISDNNRYTARLCCTSCEKIWIIDNHGNVLDR